MAGCVLGSEGEGGGKDWQGRGNAGGQGKISEKQIESEGLEEGGREGGREGGKRDT